MILQALKEYYERKLASGEGDIAPEGFEYKEIPYIIVLDDNGIPVSIQCTVEGTGKKKRAHKYLVPKAIKKTSGIASNLLWENPEYALGVDLKGDQKKAEERHSCFVQRIRELKLDGEKSIETILNFLSNPEKLKLLEALGDSWKELIENATNVSFQIAGESELIAEKKIIRDAYISCMNSESKDRAICLVTGGKDTIARVHPAIKGVWGAQTSGANIVSFNKDSFTSFNKDQCYNAPIGKSASFAYTEALNILLDKDSSQRIRVGDASTVFWSEKKSELETLMSAFFSEPPKDDPDRGSRAVKSLFSSPINGSVFIENSNNRFYVLGLSPNASRISVRFWSVDTVSGMSQKIVTHFNDISVTHGPKEKETLSLFRLLASTALQGKSDNIPPDLAGNFMRAILEEKSYPRTILQAVLTRIRAEHEVTYPRAALIKAFINRQTRFQNPEIPEEIKMSLDRNNKNAGYRLGRLFATLEKIQERTHPGLNATIRDRFYGAASGTPVTVFGNLMRLKNHHLSKMENPGERINYEKLLGEIMSEINDFPGHLSLDDQGRFAIGYYHQRQDFFSKKADNSTEEQKEN